MTDDYHCIRCSMSHLFFEVACRMGASPPPCVDNLTHFFDRLPPEDVIKATHSQPNMTQ